MSNDNTQEIQFFSDVKRTT